MWPFSSTNRVSTVSCWGVLACRGLLRIREDEDMDKGYKIMEDKNLPFTRVSLHNCHSSTLVISLWHKSMLVNGECRVVLGRGMGLGGHCYCQTHTFTRSDLPSFHPCPHSNDPSTISSSSHLPNTCMIFHWWKVSSVCHCMNLTPSHLWQ